MPANGRNPCILPEPAGRGVEQLDRPCAGANLRRPVVLGDVPWRFAWPRGRAAASMAPGQRIIRGIGWLPGGAVGDAGLLEVYVIDVGQGDGMLMHAARRCLTHDRRRHQGLGTDDEQGRRQLRALEIHR
jgi:hypothetical protein